MPASWDETRRLGVMATDKFGGRIKLGPHLELGFSHIVTVISHSGDLLPMTTTFYYQIIQDDCSVLQEPIAARPKFGRLHIPTGQVSLEDILLCLIDGFGVRIAVAAKELLLEERARFERTQTWAGRRGRQLWQVTPDGR
jgi:hypothetical protein